MRVLVLSDIHANFTALDAVLASAGDFDAAWCLGDLVGYGPDPNECIERIRCLPNLLCVKGNHDAAVTGQSKVDFFNDDAGSAILITRKLITPANMKYLEGLSEIESNEVATLVHGSPRHPIWEYILDLQTAQMNFHNFTTPIALVGHTHLPLAFSMNGSMEHTHRQLLKPDMLYPVKGKSILNPGSVGQPRDYDPRASFAILVPETLNWEIHRVSYDIPSVQQRILKAGLPEKHALRLTDGW